MPPRPRPSRRPKPLQSPLSSPEPEPVEAAPPSASKIPAPRASASESQDSGPQEHYTYQEMIDHLRKAGSGRQSIKSKKKRRRRSHQPIRARRRKRLVVTLSTVGIVLPLITFVVGSYLFSYLYYESDAFREHMSQSVSEAIEFEAEFDAPFRVSQLSFKNTLLHVTGSDHSILAHMRMENLDAQIPFKSFFSDRWDIEHLLVDKTRLYLRPRPAAQDSTAQVVPSQAPEFELAALGFNGAPETFDLSKLSLHHVNFLFGHNIDRLHSLDDSHWTLSNEGPQMTIIGEQGTLRYGNWPEMTLSRATFTADKSGRFTISDQARLTTENGGSCHVTGSLMFGGSNPAIHLNANVAGFKTDEVVSPLWRDRLAGPMNGQFTLQSILLADHIPHLTGEISIPGFAMKNIPILDELSVFFGSTRLKRLEFEEFQAKVESKEGVLTLYDIYARQPDLMILTGNLTIDAGSRLSGTLQIGLPDSILRRPTQNDSVIATLFELREDAHNWVEFHLGGTLEEPGEDLIARLRGVDPSELPQRQEDRFDRPTPLEMGPQDLYRRHLEALFDQLIQ